MQKIKKSYYTITVSDVSSSKYFAFGKTAKRDFITIASGILVLFVISLVANIHQYNNTRLLTTHANQNAQLFESIENRDQQLERISQIVSGIEEFSGVETADVDVPLEYRIGKIGEYYTNRELTYSEIGNRVEVIESLVGIDGKINEYNQEDDLSARVDLVSLNASQKRIIHDNLPNGYPSKSKVVTSKYGKRKHPVTKIMSFHKGIDLRSPVGTPIFATADGVVTNSGYDKLSGNKIAVTHNFGFETRFAHLEKSYVKRGDVVYKGDIIGEAGNTGLSNGAHLHYEIRYLGKSVNPDDFLKWQFGSDDIFNTVGGIQWASLINLINKQITNQTLQLSQLEPTFVEN